MLFTNYDSNKKKVQLENILKALEAERISFERKLKPIKQSDHNELGTFLRKKIIPYLTDPSEVDHLSEMQVLQLASKELQAGTKPKKSKDSNAFEREIVQLQNEKASLINQIDILKIQAGRDKGE